MITPPHEAASYREPMDWVQWLTLAGGLTAVVTFVTSRRDATRSEAAGLYAVVTGYQAAPAPADRPVHTRYKVVNDGQQPALAVGISAWGWGRRRWTWRVRPHADWMTGTRIVGTVYPSISPRSETPEDEFPGVDVVGPAEERPPLMLIYRDGHGRRWVRWPDAKLTRLSPSRHAYVVDRSHSVKR